MDKQRSDATLRRRTPFAVAILLAVVCIALPAPAPPPITSFPAAIEPSRGVVPINSKIWLFGTGAPDPSTVSVDFSVDSQTSSVSLMRQGCCLIIATPNHLRSGAATATVSDGVHTLSSYFTVGTVTDTTSPVLMAADLIDSTNPQRFVIGVRGADDHGVAAYVARGAGDMVTGAVPPGFALTAQPNADSCVMVSAVDYAGNESCARLVCAALDGGVSDGGADAGTADAGTPSGGGGCSATPGAPSGVILGAAYLWLVRRRAAKQA